MKLGIFRKKFTNLYELIKKITSILDYLFWLLFSPAKFKKIKTKKIDKILVVLVSGGKGNVGGNFCNLGVLNYFKENYPKIKVSILIDKNTLEQFGKIPGIEMIEYKGLKTLETLKKHNFKAVLDLGLPNDFSLKNLRFISYSVSSSNRTICNFFKEIGKNFFITRKVYFPWKMHIVTINFKLLEALGFKFPEKELKFYYSKKEENKVKKFLKKHKIQKFIILHPGAKTIVKTLKKREIPSKFWSFRKYARVANYFSKKGYKILITGTKEEKILADTINKKTKTNIINCCGIFSIREMGALLKKSKLLISTDTGIVHIAYQYPINTPIIELMGISIPEFVGAWPLDSKNHKILIDRGICSRSNKTVESPENINCLENIKSKQVINEAEKLLRRRI